MGDSLPSAVDSEPVSYLGRGVYDVGEAARLLSRSRSQIKSWARPHRNRPPLLTGELSGLFSFWDLLTLRVIAELTRRGVPRDHIARGAAHLERSLNTGRPFAHRGLATAGAGFFAEINGGWEDAGLGGQLPFPEVIEPLLEPLTFNDADMASIWRPWNGVWINPAVQAGASCVDGTRVPTQLLASLLDPAAPDEEHLSEMCDDYRLTTEQVQAALDYELDLAA